MAFVSAGLGAVDQPARSSAVPRLVPRERLPAAIALNQLGFQAMAVAGPALGGILIATVGVAAASRSTPSPSRPRSSPSSSSLHPSASRCRAPVAGNGKEGLRFVRRRRIILSTFVIDFVAMVFGMPTSLFPALALDVFHVGAAGLA